MPTKRCGFPGIFGELAEQSSQWKKGAFRQLALGGGIALHCIADTTNGVMQGFGQRFCLGF